MERRWKYKGVSMFEVDDQRPSEHPDAAVASALRTIRMEMEAMADLIRCVASPAFAPAFARAASTIVTAPGRVIVSGMGKSGLIARKIAATLASTGTPSFFIHPAEASHGDLGMITTDDVVLVLSWSGETAEMSDIVTFCRRFGVPLIAMTARSDSSLAEQADICLALPRVQEACPNQLAPTSSTTIQLALGDALAVALIGLRGFSSEEFRTFHPKGKLGAQLITVGDLMTIDDAVPRVSPDATILQAIVEMSLKRFGVTAVTDQTDRLVGAFTDGDLRRSAAMNDLAAPVGARMTRQPVQVSPGMLASEGLGIMNAHNISQLFVCEDGCLIGVLHIHDILRAGVV